MIPKKKKKFNTNDVNLFFLQMKQKRWIYGLSETFKIQIVFEQSKLAKQTLRIIRKKGQTQASNHQQQVISFQN